VRSTRFDERAAVLLMIIGSITTFTLLNVQHLSPIFGKHAAGHPHDGSAGWHRRPRLAGALRWSSSLDAYMRSDCKARSALQAPLLRTTEQYVTRSWARSRPPSARQHAL
jgi:hypothetical protein